MRTLGPALGRLNKKGIDQMTIAGQAGKLVRILWERDSLWWQGLRKGVAAGVEHLALLQHMKINTIIDIGANRGQFALLARHCFPEAMIYSFEPLPEAAAICKELFSGDRQFALHVVAIGAKPGNATLHVSKRDDSSSLLPITDQQNILFPGTAQSRETMVRIERLSQCIKDKDVAIPALLKIDVQGFELECLEGCAELLPRIMYVYVECSFLTLYAGQPLARDVVKWMSKNGFSLDGVYNVVYNGVGRAIQADFLFLRTEGKPAE